LAAAGSAIGLGNIWKFPYITGLNGGGAFVLVYLVCIALVGLPVMAAEILLGRSSQCSPVGALKKLAGPKSAWVSVGWLGVAGSFFLLSYYSVVAGWALNYAWLSLTGQLVGLGPEGVQPLFGEVFGSSGTNLFCHTLFMGLTVAVVLGGVSKGVERWSRILMPMLVVMLLALLVNSFTLEGFARARDFVFGFHTESLTAGGILEALGHSFFTLSLGMGTMVTYGSYLHKDDDIISASITISVLDTLVALTASMVLFPIIFSYGMEPSAGPGLVFISIPIALTQMTGGAILSIVFFLLLVFAALTSSISMLEVTVSYFIDERQWDRRRATLFTGACIALFGIPSALSGSTVLFGSGFASLFGEHGKNWFDTLDYLVSNWILPLGGLGVALFTAWRMDDAIRHDHFLSGSRLKVVYKGWLLLLKFLVPVAIVLVFLHAVGVI
jgi:NSS family neurotransmitter:Na+ symporter